jgi:hypothetical protein
MSSSPVPSSQVLTIIFVCVSLFRLFSCRNPGAGRHFINPKSLIIIHNVAINPKSYFNTESSFITRNSKPKTLSQPRVFVLSITKDLTRNLKPKTLSQLRVFVLSITKDLTRNLRLETRNS